MALDYSDILLVRQRSGSTSLEEHILRDVPSSLISFDSTSSLVARTYNELAELITPNTSSFAVSASAYVRLIGGTISNSITGSSTASLLTLNHIWDTTGLPTALKLNVTDTASDASSLLMDLQLGNTSKFKVYKSGYLTSVSGMSVSGLSSFAGGIYGANVAMGYHPNTVTSMIYGFTGGSVDNPDTYLHRDESNVIAQRNVTNAQTFRVYGTYTDSNNYLRASLSCSSTSIGLAAETAGTGEDNVDINIIPAGTGKMVVRRQSSDSLSPLLAGPISSSGGFRGMDSYLSASSATAHILTLSQSAAHTGSVIRFVNSEGYSNTIRMADFGSYRPMYWDFAINDGYRGGLMFRRAGVNHLDIQINSDNTTLHAADKKLAFTAVDDIGTLKECMVVSGSGVLKIGGPNAAGIDIYGHVSLKQAFTGNKFYNFYVSDTDRQNYSGVVVDSTVNAVSFSAVSAGTGVDDIHTCVAAFGTGSVFLSSKVTASFGVFGTSSFAISASYAPGAASVSASYALTASSIYSVSNYLDNRVLTSNGTISGSNAETSFTFDGTSALISGSLHVSRPSASLEVYKVSSRNSSGDISERIHQYRVSTTDATPTPVFLSTIPTDTVVGFDITVIARRTGGAAGTDQDGGFFRILTQYNNITGTATVIGSDGVYHSNSNTGTISVASVAEGGNVNLNVTGNIDTDMVWHITAKIYSVST